MVYRFIVCATTPLLDESRTPAMDLMEGFLPLRAMVEDIPRKVAHPSNKAFIDTLNLVAYIVSINDKAPGVAFMSMLEQAKNAKLCTMGIAEKYCHTAPRLRAFLMSSDFMPYLCIARVFSR